MSTRLAVFLASSLVCSAAIARPSLSPVEQRIVQAIDARGDAPLALLERVVDVNSGTMNLAGVRAVGDIFRAELDELGFTTRWIDGAPFARAGHLIAERPGSDASADKPKILFIGHLDTVFEPSSPFQRFERTSATHARGPGTTDMKGGIVILLEVFRALAAVDALDQMRATVVLIGDEERVGSPRELARRDLIEAARRSDFAIAFEDGDGDPETAVIARRGSSTWTLHVTGNPAHSSQIFRDDVGAGAIYEVARILNAFREEMAGQPYLTFNPGVVVGGTDVDFDRATATGTAFGKNNVIAEHATATGDLRTLSPDQLERARATMRTIVAAGSPHTTATIEFDDGYPPMPPSDGNRRLLAMLDRASRDLGHGPVQATDPAKAGAADVSFTAAHVEMAIDGLGLMGTGGHTVDELADLTTLPVQTRRVAVLLYRLMQ